MTHVLNLEEEILFFERSADGDKEFFSLMDLLMFCSTVATITLLWPNQIREELIGRWLSSTYCYEFHFSLLKISVF